MGTNGVRDATIREDNGRPDAHRGPAGDQPCSTTPRSFRGSQSSYGRDILASCVALTPLPTLRSRLCTLHTCNRTSYTKSAYRVV